MKYLEQLQLSSSFIVERKMFYAMSGCVVDISYYIAANLTDGAGKTRESFKKSTGFFQAFPICVNIEHVLAENDHVLAMTNFPCCKRYGILVKHKVMHRKPLSQKLK